MSHIILESPTPNRIGVFLNSTRRRERTCRRRSGGGIYRRPISHTRHKFPWPDNVKRTSRLYATSSAGAHSLPQATSRWGSGRCWAAPAFRGDQPRAFAAKDSQEPIRPLRMRIGEGSGSHMVAAIRTE